MLQYENEGEKNMSILEEFYFGNIQPDEMPPQDSKECKKALRIFSECEDKLEEVLEGDSLKLLQKMMQAYGTIVAEMGAANFRRGFRLAIQMVFDCEI